MFMVHFASLCAWHAAVGLHARAVPAVRHHAITQSQPVGGLLQPAVLPQRVRHVWDDLRPGLHVLLPAGPVRRGCQPAVQGRAGGNGVGVGCFRVAVFLSLVGVRCGLLTLCMVRFHAVDVVTPFLSVL